MIRILVPGWNSPFAKLNCIYFSRKEPLLLNDGSVLEWNKVEIPELRWEHIGMMLILEGAPIQSFFSSCALETNELSDMRPKSWILLKATHSKIYEPVPRMTDVVLAEVGPQYVRETGIYGTLLSLV